MANNPYINKVDYAGQTLMDLTGDTVSPSDVLNGVTFHDRSGAPQTGSLITHDVYDGLDSTSTDDALSAYQGKVLNDKTSWTSVSNAVSAGSKFTLDTCICYKFGYLTVLAFTVIAKSTYGTSDSLITGIPSSYRPAVNISGLWSQLIRNSNTYNYIGNVGVRTDGTARQSFTSNGQSGDTISAVFIFPNE